MKAGINHLKLLALGVLPLAICTGCGTTLLDNKKIDYKSAGRGPSLEVPPDLTRPEADDRYVMPETPGAGPTNYSTYASTKEGAALNPTTSGVLPLPDKVRLERSGTQRWLTVETSPEQLWPVVKEFWQETGFIIKIESPETGIIETDWAENRALIPQDPIRNLLGKVLDSLYSTAERDKFRTRLERGTTPGTTEIYISHRGMFEEFDTSDISSARRTVWQPRPADPELEAEMLRRLMLRLGVQESKAKTLLTNTEWIENAKLSKTASGANALILSDAFDRAWRRVGLALDRVGFTVVDRDRSKGLYFVRYVDPEIDNKKESKGFLAKLAFWRSDDQKASAQQYQVMVKELATGSQVLITDQAGSEDKSETSQRILNLLYEQLK